MMFQPRTLIGNSLGSVFASGLVIFATVLLPAILVRALSQAQYNEYLTALAFLPILLVLPQSIRSVGASQLALAAVPHGLRQATSEFVRFTCLASFGHLVICWVGIEIYLSLKTGSDAGHRSIQIGLYCLLAYTLGLFALGTVVAPAAAQRDFRPDNLAKFWPSLFQLSGILLVWLLRPVEPLLWTFLAYVGSSWSIAFLLFLRFGHRPTWRFNLTTGANGELVKVFFRGLGGVLWWNVTAFLSTTASVTIIAINFPSALAAFSNATALLGIVSAGLVAISGPITLHAATMHGSNKQSRRRFFLVVNSLFQFYIFASALFLALIPKSVYALWLNATLADGVKTFSLLLLPSAVLRILTMAFTLFVMSAGRQHTLFLSPLVEALLSVIGSLILGHYLGAYGIPLALAIAAAARLGFTLFHDHPRNQRELGLEPNDLLFSAWHLLRSRRC